MFNYIFLTIILIIFVIFIIFYYKINTYLYKERNKETYDNKKETYDNKKEYVLDDITITNLLQDYNKIK